MPETIHRYQEREADEARREERRDQAARVVPSPWDFTVEVTRADIDGGDPLSMTRNPIAIAIARAVGIQRVFVQGANVAWVRPRGSVVETELPQVAQLWDTVYEDGGAKAVHPFEFTLSVPA